MRAPFRGPLPPRAVGLPDVLARPEELERRRRAKYPLPFRRIVVGFDGSLPSLQAVAWADALGSSGKVHLVHVVEKGDADGASCGAAAAELRARGLDAEARAVAGDAAHDIVAFADAVDADLVILGNSGGFPLKRRLLGSVGDAVLRQSARPLLLARGRPPVKHVLVAADGSADSDRASAVGAAVALAADAHATLLYVRAAWEPVGAGPRGSFPAPVAAVPIDERARFEVVGDRGEAAEVILAWAEHRHSELIVLGRTGKGGRALVGGVAEAVASRAKASVLLIRAQP